MLVGHAPATITGFTQFIIPAGAFDILWDISQFLNHRTFTQNLGQLLPADIAHSNILSRAGIDVSLYGYGACIQMAGTGQPGHRGVRIPFNAEALKDRALQSIFS